MNSESKKQSKNIPEDPVEYFKKRKPGHSEHELTELTKLWHEHCSIKNKFQEIDAQTKELSKNIGESKKAGKDIGDLKLLMQDYSKQKAAFNQQLQNIEAEIHNFLDLTDETNTPETTSKIVTTRIYPDKTCIINEISIDLLGDDDKSWNAYVRKNQSATIYHLAEWRDLIKNTFGHDGYYLYASDTNNNIKGVLPLIRLKSRLFGDFLVSMPYFNYGGAIADHPDIEKILMAAANQHATELNVSHIEYRDDVARADYPARTDKVNMILALPPSKEELWNNFTPKLRAQIKRPQREKPEIQHGSIDLLDDFYDVFARNMRDLGTPVYSKSFFHNILMSFPEQSSVLTIRLEGKPVAAAFLIGYGNSLEIPWASTIRSVNHLSINMLMYWEVLGFAIEKNYKYFDFGRSSKEAGTYLFKKQWGALPKQSYWHYWHAQGKEIPSLNPSNPKFSLAINVWKRLPLALTKLLGPMIVKNLP